MHPSIATAARYHDASDTALVRAEGDILKSCRGAMSKQLMPDTLLMAYLACTGNNPLSVESGCLAFTRRVRAHAVHC